ncbi:MAG TPA: ribonuclease J [Candidatus Saccharimonadales bacterium]|nr:ribonuclease J [Candidatus Saccharimonadales bacterium]
MSDTAINEPKSDMSDAGQIVKPAFTGQTNKPKERFRRRNPQKNWRPKERQTPIKTEASKNEKTIHRGAIGSLRIIPLGGSDEVGDKNMIVFEYGSDIIIVDCGVKFPSADMPGIDYVVCDVTYLEERRERIRGIVITHGHEDHIGGLPYIWPKLPVPIFTAPLTAGLIKAKFEEHGINNAEFRIINPGDSVQLGAFKIEPVRMTHSIPDILGLAITTPVGLVYQATDWKFDFTPTFGETTDFAKLSELAQRGVLCLMNDSTNVMEPGYTMSEQVVGHALEDIFEDAKGRIIVSSFASRIDRIQHVIRACVKTNRKLALSGRSMERNANIAMELGYLKVLQGLLVDIRQINTMPDDKVVVMSTGSQGEENSALVRMASGEHRHIHIKKGDTVVLSASQVPGNERGIEQTINNLYRQGAEVITNKQLDVHSSGHANREEIKLLISLLKPKFVMPIHGDYRRLKENGKVAMEIGVKEENCLIAENGQIVEFDERGGRVLSERIKVGQVLIDGAGVGDVGEIVLRDRQTMAKDGLFLVILTVEAKSGRLLNSPDIISRGFVYMKEAEELITGARELAKKIHAQMTAKKPISWDSLKKELRDKIGDYLYEQTQRNPMIVSTVIQV